MIRSADVIFENGKAKKNQDRKKILTNEGLDGDSGVGQASESSSRLLENKSRHFYHSSRLLSRLGTVLIIFSILGFLLTYGPIIKVEIGYQLSKILVSDAPQKGSFAQLLNQTLLEEPEGVPDPNFSLIIPKIHAKGKIVPNVDASDETEYFEALKTGIAHAKGTRFPGSGGTIYLFAHSTDSPVNILRYNAVFYLLRELEAGDEVQVYFGGVKHRYNVTDKQIVEPTDVSYLSPTNPQNKELLILQTCWPPGTTLKRLLIFANK